jgi:hypothetical protein
MYISPRIFLDLLYKNIKISGIVPEILDGATGLSGKM